MNSERRINPSNPPHGNCTCDCHALGAHVFHCFPCCTPERGELTLQSMPPLFGGLKPEEQKK